MSESEAAPLGAGLVDFFGAEGVEAALAELGALGAVGAAAGFEGAVAAGGGAVLPAAGAAFEAEAEVSDFLLLEDFFDVAAVSEAALDAALSVEGAEAPVEVPAASAVVLFLDFLVEVLLVEESVAEVVADLSAVLFLDFLLEALLAELSPAAVED